jgi:hypothetical protein
LVIGSEDKECPVGGNVGGPAQEQLPLVAVGDGRCFTFNDAMFLKVIADLLARGIEVKHLS